MRTKLILVLLVAAVSLAAASPSQCQIVYGRSASGTVGFVYSSWSVEDSAQKTDITQIGFPVRLFLPLQDNLEADVYVATSSNSMDQGENDYSLSGLGDLRVQFNRSFSDDQLLVSVGVNLPTGKTKLTRDGETPVLQMLTANYLSFSQRRFGEGFGFNILLGGARMIGVLRCGAGLSYRYIGKYDPYEGVEEYDPGDLISFNAGADWENGPTMISGNVVFSMYGKDKWNDREVFRESSQIGFGLSVSHNPEGSRAGGSLGYIARGRNSVYTPKESKLKIYGNELSLAGDLLWLPPSGWSYGPNAVLRLIAKNEQGFGSSTIFGFGGTVGRKLGDTGSLEVSLRYFTGSADGGNTDVSGLQISTGIRISR
jgi:hypothetical protein